MMKSVFALGILGAAGAVSICDLCGISSPRPAASLVAVARAATTASSAPVATPRPDTETVTFRVEGMTCGGCVIGVRKVLTRLAGVTKADVRYEQQRAIVTYNPTKVTVEQMVAAIKTLGYRATVVTG